MNIRPWPHDADPPFPSLAQARDDSPWQAAMATLRARLAAQHDDAIKQALDGALGVSGWSLDSVAARCHWEVAPGHETLFLDGRPLVHLSRPVPSMRYDDPVWDERDLRMISMPGYRVEFFPWRPQ